MWLIRAINTEPALIVLVFVMKRDYPVLPRCGVDKLSGTRDKLVHRNIVLIQ